MKEHELPEWLNEEYFLTLLHLKEPSAKLLSYDIAPAVQGGNNYCSRMWRVKLTYKDGTDEGKSTSLMIKAPVPDGIQKQFLDEAKYVDKEYSFYNKVLPLMHSVTDNIKMFPKSYESTIPGTIALEDLKEQGYIMCDRLNMLDFDHCQLLMKTLAEYHALSVVVRKQNSILFESIGEESCFSKGNRTSGIFRLCKRNFSGFSKQIKSWEGFQRFNYISEDKLELFFDKTADVFLPSQNLNVLNHGDIWTNNILFKYDDAGRVVDAKLIDFQVCRKGSPGIDLHFFTWTSIMEDVRKKRLDELYEIYLYSLNSKLEELGCEERLSKQQFHEELSATRFYGVFVLCVMMPFFFGDPTHPVDIDKLLDTKEFDENDKAAMAKAFQSKYFNSVARDILLHLEDTLVENLCKP